MKQTTISGESKKVINRSTKQPVNKNETSEIQKDPVTKAQSKIRQTYHEYEEVQRDLENAFKDRERESQEAFSYSEKAYKAYEEALETAFKNRENAEQDAYEHYRKAIGETGTIYAGAMIKALKDCKKSTEEARDLLTGIPIKEAGSNLNNPILFRLEVKKPHFEGLKRGIVKFKEWCAAKKILISQKFHGSSQTTDTESVAE